MTKSRYFNAVEMLIVIAIIGILISILLPALSKARAISMRNVCQANLKHAGIAYTLYVYDNKKLFPTMQHSGYRYAMGKEADNVGFYERPLNHYLDTSEFAECPADKGHPMWNLNNVFNAWGSSYTAPWNNDIYAIGYLSHRTKPKSMDFFEHTDKKIIMGDHPFWANRSWADGRSHWHWNGDLRRANLLFLDMHVEFFTFPAEYNSFAHEEPLDINRWKFY